MIERAFALPYWIDWEHLYAVVEKIVGEYFRCRTKLIEGAFALRTETIEPCALNLSSRRKREWEKIWNKKEVYRSKNIFG